MNYILDDFMVSEKLFRFVFDDGKWIALDLANNFPDYECPLNSGTTDSIHMTCIDSGNVRLFETEKLREKSTLIKFHEFDGKMYKKTNQTEYDNHKFKTDPLSDNGRVYNILENQYNKKNKIKVTII